jgi:decaprenylphospho-beta-D-ribofuranose 2-oxidase
MPADAPTAPTAPARRHATFTGWARTAPSSAEEVLVADDGDAKLALEDVGPRGLIARGLGRAYGDAAQCAGGRVASCAGWSGLTALDLQRGVVTAHAGTSLDQLMRWLVPLGWFVPVTPGTRQVTVGGAIAADIHGKNHHRDGSFAQHVEQVRLLLPDGQEHVVAPDHDPDLFWATAGGMGLTGVIAEATVRLQPIESSRLVVDTDRTVDLDHTMEAMAEGDRVHHYSVAWIDLVTTGRSMGRSVLTQGRFARRDELTPALQADPLAFDAKELITAPPWVPPGLLNRLSVRAFNELWYRKAPIERRGELQRISTFFHPLDGVRGWNRMYGDRGFLQWQCVVPFGAEDVLRHIVERLSRRGCLAFFAVLKRFGAASPGHLSFPAPGWTLALDIPIGVPGLAPLLDALDVDVAACGGRLYLAKDSRMRREIFEATYPRLGEWRAIRDRVDPHGRLRSDLGHRLGLC